MRPWSSVSVLSVLLGLILLEARGQPAASIDQMEISLWPEYDRPAVLVMYRFRLEPDSSLPAEVAVPIPAAAGEPHAVAWRDASGALLNAEFRRLVEGERAMMVMTMRALEGQLEFYQDLDIEEGRRRFQFSWPGGVPVGSLSFNVQQPEGASDLQILPPAQARSVGQDGLTYARVDIGPIDASATPGVQLSYEKATEALTAEGLAPPPSEAPSRPIAASAPEEGGSLLPWFAGGFGGLLIGFLAGWRMGSSSRLEPEEGSSESRRASFCHYCGAKAPARGSFCGACGTRLRR